MSTRRREADSTIASCGGSSVDIWIADAVDISGLTRGTLVKHHTTESHANVTSETRAAFDCATVDLISSTQDRVGEMGIGERGDREEKEEGNV